jgi:hypothetical protein
MSEYYTRIEGGGGWVEAKILKYKKCTTIRQSMGTANYWSPLCGVSVSCSARRGDEDDAAIIDGRFSPAELRGNIIQGCSVSNAGRQALSRVGYFFVFCF